MGTRSMGARIRRSLPGRAQAFRFRSKQAGSAKSITVYIARHSTAKVVAVGLYSDRAGHPGSLLTSGSLQSPRRGAWNSITVPATTIRPRTFYWIAVLARGGTLLLREGACNTSPSYMRRASVMPARWRAGRRLKACEISAYVSGGAGTGTTILGGAPTYYGGVTPVVPSASLPGGVSLQQIDGGPSYYCSSGFTYACNAGWDNSSFFPILDDYAFYTTNSTATFKALGLTTAVRVTGGTNMNYLRSAGVTAIQAGDETTNTGSETVGAHIEEPGSWTDITSQANSLAGQFGLPGRLLQPSFTWTSLYYGDLNGNACGANGTMTMQQVMSCTSGMPGGRHLDIPTDDLYWFAGSGNVGRPVPGRDALHEHGNVHRRPDGPRLELRRHGRHHAELADGLPGAKRAIHRDRGWSGDGRPRDHPSGAELGGLVDDRARRSDDHVLRHHIELRERSDVWLQPEPAPESVDFHVRTSVDHEQPGPEPGTGHQLAVRAPLRVGDPRRLRIPDLASGAGAAGST